MRLPAGPCSCCDGSQLVTRPACRPSASQCSSCSALIPLADHCPLPLTACPSPPCLAPPCLPAVEMGSYGVVPNYFEQNQAEALDLDISVMDTLVK